jgi:hypothetical protein
VDEIRLIEGFTAFKCKDLRIDVDGWKNQIET